MPRRVLAHHNRQPVELLEIPRTDQFPFAINERDAAFSLPQGKWAALDDADQDRVGKLPTHGSRPHPAQGLDALACLPGIQIEQRIPLAHAQRGGDILIGGMTAPRDDNPREPSIHSTGSGGELPPRRSQRGPRRFRSDTANEDRERAGKPPGQKPLHVSTS